MYQTAKMTAATAVIAAAMALGGLIWGNIYIAEKQRELERFKLKADAYANFLGQLELIVPTKKDETLRDNDKIKELNKALSILLTKAPDCVVKDINERLFGSDRSKAASLNRGGIQKLQLILHNDLNDQVKCAASQLIEEDFPNFPFQ